MYSLTTTTGQGKGTAPPLPDTPFPFPYTDDFESAAVGQSAKYLSDQNGSFEVAGCAKRKGNCLLQTINRIPIPYGPDMDPFTFLGSTDWKDYEVSVDALLQEPGTVAVLGRIDSGRYWSDAAKPSIKFRWPSGYGLTVQQDGKWEVVTSSYKAPATRLAFGTAPFSPRKWHRLALAFEGSNIQASLDGTVVARVSDTSHKAGMAGFGSGWNRAQFDTFSVRRAE